LKFKTVPGSQYVAYQIIGDDGTATSKLINWQTKTSVLEINDPLDNLIWTKNGQDAYFAKGGQIIKHSLTTGSETKIATVTPPVLAFEIAGEKSLFIETQVSPQVININ
jgi:hypothetical protein